MATMTMAEALQQELDNEIKVRGPDSLFAKALQTQLSAVKSSEAMRLRGAGVESPPVDKYVAQVVLQSNSAKRISVDPAIGAVRAMEARFGKQSTTDGSQT